MSNTSGQTLTISNCANLSIDPSTPRASWLNNVNTSTNGTTLTYWFTGSLSKSNNSSSTTIKLNATNQYGKTTSYTGTINCNWVAKGYVYYNTAGSYNWTVPKGVCQIRVITVGGGGGGACGKLDSNGVKFAGGGGGGSGYEHNAQNNVTPGTVLAWTVGAGGAGGDTNHNNGYTGGSTSGDSLPTSNGGNGGSTNGSSIGGNGQNGGGAGISSSSFTNGGTYYAGAGGSNGASGESSSTSIGGVGGTYPIILTTGTTGIVFTNGNITPTYYSGGARSTNNRGAPGWSGGGGGGCGLGSYFGSVPSAGNGASTPTSNVTGGSGGVGFGSGGGGGSSGNEMFNTEPFGMDAANAVFNGGAGVCGFIYAEWGAPAGLS